MGKDPKDVLVVENQSCPVCSKKKATFSEYEVEDPFAGIIAIFAVKCNLCGFKNSDIEFANPKVPAQYSVDVESVSDLSIRVIKSGLCQIEIPQFKVSVDSTMEGCGFISNVEGVLNRFKKQVEFLMEDSAMDNSKMKKLNGILDGIEEVFNGKRKITLRLVDDSGNSAIVSDKVRIKKLKNS